MEDKELQEAQRKLEEKRASLKQTQPTAIGLGVEVCKGDVLGPCSKCGKEAKATAWDAMRLNGDLWSYRPVPAGLTCEDCEAEAERIAEAEAETRRAESKERARKDEIQRKLDRSGIAPLFRECKWDDYVEVNADAAKVKKSCREYAETFQKDSPDLVMIGACGTGKNMLASLIGRHIIWNGFTYEYTTAMRLVRSIKDSWRDKDATEQEVIDSFTRPDLLCIDEIGVQFGSPTEQLFITEVINNRYEAIKPTMLISNLTLKQIEEVLGARAVDRFHERGKFLVFKWESYRRRK